MQKAFAVLLCVIVLAGCGTAQKEVVDHGEPNGYTYKDKNGNWYWCPERIPASREVTQNG